MTPQKMAVLRARVHAGVPAPAARSGLLLGVLLCLHGGADSQQQTALEGDFGQPTFGMPNSYRMAQHSLQIGHKGGTQESPEASLSSYDQQILAKGPPGVGAGGGTPQAGASQGPTPYASATSGYGGESREISDGEQRESRGRARAGDGGGERDPPHPGSAAALRAGA